MDFMKKPAIIETLVDILLCAVPIWVGVMIGLVIGWSWRPRWTGLLYLGLRSKFRFLWTAPPGFGALRLWLAFTALSAFSVARKIWSNFKGKGEGSVGSDLAVSAESARSEERDGGVDLISGASDKDQDIITEKDLEHLLQLLEGKLGEMAWQSLMQRSTPSMAYQAWQHDPEAKSMFPSLAGTKRKETALATGANVALAVVSKKKTQQKEWSCALCKVSATSEQGLNDHLKGKKHKAREAELRNNVALAVVSKKEWSCALCKVSATSEQGLNDHLKGKKHKAREAELRNNVALAVVCKKEWRCALCKVSATSEQGLNDHLKGKKHKAREAELRKNSTSKSTGNCTTSSKKTDKNVKTTGSSNLKQGKLLQVKKNGESPEKKKQKAEGTKGKEDAPVQKKKKTEDAKKKKLEATPPQKKKLTVEMKKKKFKFWCEMCQIGAYGEAVMEAHRKGKKHMAKLQKLKQKDVAGPAMTTQDATSKKSQEMENVDGEVDALTEADREEAGGKLAEADATRERPSSKDEGIDGSAASLVSGSKNSPTDEAGQST